MRFKKRNVRLFLSRFIRILFYFCSNRPVFSTVQMSLHLLRFEPCSRPSLALLLIPWFHLRCAHVCRWLTTLCVLGKISGPKRGAFLRNRPSNPTANVARKSQIVTVNVGESGIFFSSNRPTDYKYDIWRKKLAISSGFVFFKGFFTWRVAKLESPPRVRTPRTQESNRLYLFVLINLIGKFEVNVFGAAFLKVCRRRCSFAIFNTIAKFLETSIFILIKPPQL